MKKIPLQTYSLIKLRSLALPEANRLRKNLCQALSCKGINGLHYRPLPCGEFLPFMQFYCTLCRLTVHIVS